ncbi:hypothetical protein BDV23DRAFT_182112 [Aspergillus alliaceus]|uniref:DUF5872 domain-containing protein n=1 Tax=Petromyces alliaceus TaxID=209559 RepID=A0A5N7CCV6_PETAA|nr:hypothetical protein BDV23DRAFT_182112 [Aspergillus alliaceus]
MPAQDNYTDPELREQVKAEVKQSDKGGKPGQWSARKAQLMASKYKKRGGDYATSKEEGQDESQKSLDQWGKEEWQTKEGSGTAKQDDGTRKRYLPKAAWEKMSKQFVSNTGKAKKGRKEAAEERKKEDQQEEGQGSESEESGLDRSDESEEVGGIDEGEEDGRQDDESQNSGDQSEQNAQAGKKRSAAQEDGANKKKPRTHQDSKVGQDEESEP